MTGDRPRGITEEMRNPENNFRFASLDGDADRLVYFYFDKAGHFKLLDGDRIAVLIAAYLGKLMQKAGLSDTVKLGVVQTAYANGSSTRYLKKMGVNVAMAMTGVKHLHHMACELFDVGIYFEANGHGTVIFNEHAKTAIENGACMKLKILMSLINQCVGDALSDLLLVEAVLADENLSMAEWDEQYHELPNQQAKLKVADRSIYITTAADTKLLEPAWLQPKIDELVDATKQGRAFVRPSGTEDVVRIYAEAESTSEMKLLVASITSLLLL